ncbi:signaling protein with putative diguanylate phosphodiesterase function [Octadecabacter antarcticus 307]|uniref:Signaling protein with putative diguanylate phosphodiesterase function n=1 Tax=Octadecabacter antarcticus 307 TaxID=391626 RepID=M9R6J9_9RHOB|nr:EAL domain-containing protein [Octadecabacter antarcticus]AGI65926.1 signaling protein with putative diguanylate phosphodiesterase function [Octadecabacter antarcticus 307]
MAMKSNSAAWDDQTPRDPLGYAVSVRDRDVLSMVRRALEAEHCQLAMQPVRTSKPGYPVAFYECLIRLMDETGRVIPAAQFMGEVEETSLGRDIDAASLKFAFQLLKQNPSIRLSVNVSARSLGDAAWRRVLDSELASAALHADRMILEISEDSAMQLPEVVIRFMEEMQPFGLAFALDDFGAGMTAFRYLKDFFFDLVKINSHFTRNIDKDPDNQVLAKALITVAHQFEMFAVAGGVESQAEADFLISIGADCVQGYHFGVPKFSI